MKQIYMKINILVLLIFSISFYSCSADGASLADKSCKASCEYWEYCNLDTAKCELNTEAEFCNRNDDCSDDNICNTGNHTCEVKLSNCKDGCYEWENCVEGICQLKPGACYWDADCGDGKYCDIDTNKCLMRDTLCDLKCETWESCTINDLSQEECVPYFGFKWNKLNLTDNDSIKAIYGIDTLAYDSENNTMVNYLSLQEDLIPERQLVLGTLNLDSGTQEEVALFDEGGITVEPFCNEFSKNCEFIFYDKENKNFVLLSLNSSSVIYFNYHNVFKSSFVFTDIPVFLENVSTVFSKNSKKFFVYSNENERESDKSQLYEFSITDMSWREVADDLPNVSDNCLVEHNNVVYSFGGIISYNSNKIHNHISKYYEISTETEDFTSFDMPSEFNERANISCAYDSKRNLIFLYGGSNIINEYNELDNKYYSDLWSFNPLTKEWKMISEITNQGTFLPPDEMGNRVFNGNIEYPNFGKNKSRMIYDEVNDRLLLLGEIPPSKGVQLYTINLSK